MQIRTYIFYALVLGWFGVVLSFVMAILILLDLGNQTEPSPYPQPFAFVGSISSLLSGVTILVTKRNEFTKEGVLFLLVGALCLALVSYVTFGNGGGNESQPVANPFIPGSSPH